MYYVILFNLLLVMKYLQIKINSIIKVVLVVGVQIFDLILIIIMVWGAYNGFRKGLVGTVASLSLIHI